MVTIPVSTMAQLQAALISSVGGDIIEMAAGNYTGTCSAGTSMSKSSEVIVRPANRNSPPVVLDGHVLIQNASNITLDGINFIGTSIESTKLGVDYPLSNEAWRFDSCSNMKVINCIIDFWRNAVRIRTPGANYEIAYNRFSRIGIDPVHSTGATVNHYWHHNSFVDPRIDVSRYNESDRHPDCLQIRAEDFQVAAGVLHQNLRIEDNLFEDPQGRQKQIFLSKEIGAAANPPGWTGTKVKRNALFSSRWNGIHIQGGLLSEIDGNLIRHTNIGLNQKPYIDIENISSGSITNNVYPRAIGYSNGALASQFTVTGNVLSTTAFPPGWVDLVDGENVGPYTGETTPPDAPTRPTEEWSNPPTNTISSHGRIGANVQVLGTDPAKYTGVLIIPDTAPAFADVSANAVSGQPAPNVRWIAPTVTTPKPFIFANPPFNAAGSVRLEMTAPVPTNYDLYAVDAGETLADITWEWKVNGGSVWSGMSTYTGTFTAPGSVPPPAPLDPLTATQWEFFGSVFAVTGMESRYTQQLRLINDAPTVVGLQWTPDDGTTWYECREVSTDVYELQPSAPGQREHTVGFEEVLSVRIRYSINTTFGPASVDTKTITGPATPPPPTPFDDGDILTDSGGNVWLIGGRPMSIAHRVRPDRVRNSDIVLTRSGDRVTVDLIDTPPGAVGVIVVYNSKPYLIHNGRARFEVVVGEDLVYIYAFNQAAIPGLMRYFPIPAS